MKRKFGNKAMKLAAICVTSALAFSSAIMPLSASAASLSANGKYYSNYESYAELLEAVGEVNLQTAEEGQVLLKNDGTLPLSGKERVSVFGVASSTTVAGPNSGDAFFKYTDFEVSDRGPIYDSLEAAGFKVNPTLADFYAAKGFSTSDCGKETIDYTKSVENSLKLYDDVGIIVLSRYGGEGSDLDMITSEEQDNMYGEQESMYENDALYTGEYAASANSGGGMMGGPPGMGGSSHDVAKTSANYDEDGTTYKHYLQLTDSEEELIDYVAKTCKKVVVVLNTSNAMECYNLREDDRVNGILLMGRGGDNGHMAVGEILAGLVNPSGKLVDEWNTDFTADPTWNNYAWNDQTGSQNMYYNGTYGTGMTEYTGNGNYDDYLTRGTTEITYGSHNQNGYYGTDYEEDIYLGYAYWETLYYEIYNGLLTSDSVTYQGNGVTHTVTKREVNGVLQTAAEAANEWWEKNVTFEFGYGLSYTSFSYNIDKNNIIATGGALESENEQIVNGFDIATDMTKANLDSSEGNPAKVKTLYIPVTVKNTGSVAGKEAVQIYVTAPYDSEDAKLQKSFVTLVGFAKTDILKPGQEQTVLVKVNVQDMASFDYEDVYNAGVTGYTLDAGEYTIRAMASSHFDVATNTADTADNYDEVKFTIAQDSTKKDNGAARLVLDDFSGNVCGAIFSESYDDNENVNGNVWATDTDEDHYTVYNSLRTSNLMADNASEEVLLTRDTFLTYFPETPTKGDLTFSSSYVEHLDYWNQFSAADNEDDEWYHTNEELIAKGWKQNQGELGENGTYEILLSDMSGIELFDDNGEMTSQWVEFMNQLTVDEMTTLIRKNYNMWRSTGLESIGKAANQQKDSYNNNGDTLLWVDAPTITATWNTDLAYDIGRVRGNLSLFNGWSAWGGPEMDTHRSPFSGRNYEYLSQDGIVGGYIAAGLTSGMEDMGVTCYVKHFALNDQETCRDGMENMVWLSEQAARQIYFKVFQMAMQEGGSSSSMTGFARFCGVPTSSNNRLMEGMVVDQWGWDGFFITDGYSGFSRCTTMATMMRSFVVPLPLNSAIPAISGRYDEESGKFYAYTGAWDTELEYKDEAGNDIETPMYNDRGGAASTAKGYYTGTEVESGTQWYYMRTLAARIFHHIQGHQRMDDYSFRERRFGLCERKYFKSRRV
ncbi:MAG: glycoside hydrolase family 3 C-terminal domain-containing protein [Candidatus Coproplasma sp.]